MSAAQDRPKSRPATPSYRENFDTIFKAKPTDVLDGDEFYNLMQAHRFASSNDAAAVIKTLDAVKMYIRNLTV